MISSHHLLGGLAVAYRKTKTSSRNSLYLRLLCATLIHLKEIRAAAAIVAFFVRVASIAAAAFVTVTTTFAAAFTVARAHFASVARRWR